VLFVKKARRPKNLKQLPGLGEHAPFWMPIEINPTASMSTRKWKSFLR
jgi:hypothetical protein